MTDKSHLIGKQVYDAKSGCSWATLMSIEGDKAKVTAVVDEEGMIATWEVDISYIYSFEDYCNSPSSQCEVWGDGVNIGF
jgi:hypothetical protein